MSHVIQSISNHLHSRGHGTLTVSASRGSTFVIVICGAMMPMLFRGAWLRALHEPVM